MACIYLIIQKNGKDGYIGRDMSAAPNYYPRCTDHIYNAYQMHEYTGGKGPSESEEFIEHVGAFNCNFGVANAPNYGLNPELFKIFRQTGLGNSKEEAHLDGAEICYIYYYRNSYAKENTIGGSQRTYSYSLEPIYDYLEQKNMKFLGDFLLTTFHVPKTKHKKTNITGGARQGSTHSSIEHMYELFYPEQKLFRQGFAAYLTSEVLSADKMSEMLVHQFPQALKKNPHGLTITQNKFQFSNKLRMDFKKNIMKDIQEAFEIGNKAANILTEIGLQCNFDIKKDQIEKIADEFCDILEALLNQKSISSNKLVIPEDTIMSKFQPIDKIGKLPAWMPKGIIKPKQNINNYIKENAIHEVLPYGYTHYGTTTDALEQKFKAILPDFYDTVTKIPDGFHTLVNEINEAGRRLTDGPLEIVSGYQVFSAETNTEGTYIRRKAGSEEAKKVVLVRTAYQMIANSDLDKITIY